MEILTLDKHVTEHLSTRNVRWNYNSPASLDPENQQNLGSIELRVLPAKSKTGCFESAFKKMMQVTQNWPDTWSMFEKKKLFPSSTNPCAEIVLEGGGFMLMDGHHRARALMGISIGHETGGTPYPEHLTLKQMAHIARQLWITCFPVHRDTVIAYYLGERELNKKKFRQLIGMFSNVLTQALIYGFYNQTRKVQWWNWIRQLGFSFDDKERVAIRSLIVQTLWDGLLEGDVRPEHKTSTVMNILKEMREKDDYSAFPILADALQDAGCEDENLLNHYRAVTSFGANRFSAGSWIFKKVGIV